MIEWKKLPRGTYRYEYNGRIAEVWQVGGGFRWSVGARQADPRVPLIYLGGGEEPTEDEACEKALNKMGV